MKTLMTLTMAIGLTATNAFALNLGPDFLGIQVPEDELQSLAPAPARAKCADFSGNWEGECVDHDGNRSTSKVKLTQFACISIGSDSFQYMLDGVKTTVDSPIKRSPGQVTNSSTGFFWNNTRDQVNFEGAMTSFGSTGANLAVSYHGSLKLVNGQLVISQSGRLADKVYSNVCTLDKK